MFYPTPQGRYHIGNLPAANYTLRIRAIGYQSDPRASVKLTADQKVSFNFALQKAPVRWSDLNTFQGTQLLPKTKAHDLSKRYQRYVFFELPDLLPFVPIADGRQNLDRRRPAQRRQIHARGDHRRRGRRHERPEVRRHRRVHDHGLGSQFAETAIARKTCRNTGRWCGLSVRAP